MSTNIDIVSRYRLTAKSIRNYLLDNNWTQDLNFKNKNLMVFSPNDNPNKKIAIPSNEKFDDFNIIAIKVLENVAHYMNLELEDILQSISNNSVDRMEFRIISKETSTGTIPIYYMTNILEGVKDLILYSACAEQTKSPVCTNPPQKAKNIVEDFRVGQTKVGSYIITIEVDVLKLEDNILPLNNCDEMYLTHKVVKRVSTALEQIESVVQNKKTTRDISKDSFKTGITANMCDALLKLKPEQPDSNIEIETTIKYSNIFNIPSPKKIIINNNYFPIIRDISKIYKENSPLGKVTLFGYIKKITDNKKVILKTTFKEKRITVEIALSEEYYKNACESMKIPNEIQVTGILTKKKTKQNNEYILTEVSDFQIIDDENQ